MKYIRQRENDSWQFRYGDYSFTDKSLDVVLQHRDRYVDAMEGRFNPFERKGIFDIELETPLIGVVSDTHLGSKYECLYELNKIYDEFEMNAVDVVVHAGNWIEGESHFNRYDINVYGVDGQIEYFMENYPKRNGIHTYFISGDDHEGWWYNKHGIDVGSLVQRDDLTYCGYMEADLDFTYSGVTTEVKLVHAGGGSAQSISLKSQQLIDSMDHKPDLLVIGHYHKAHFLPYYKGVCAIQAGAFQKQTPFMRKKRLTSTIGGWIVEIGGNIKTEFIHFKDERWIHR
jgi:predicted phosphodiesterase